MNILVTNNHLNTYGGSESYTYTLIDELVKLNYNVEYFTFSIGTTSDMIENKLGVNFMSKKSYDIVFANHINCVEYLRLYLNKNVKIIQTCHGIFPELEQPSEYADGLVSISEEVKTYLKQSNFNSKLINNGIDCKRFNITNKVNTRVERILSLCQSDEANQVLKKTCNRLNIELTCLNKHSNPIWNVEDLINESDLVVGLGRSAYEAMSCGRPIIVYDKRNYFNHCGDGYIDSKNFELSLKNNCSGRALKKVFSETELINEIKKYDSKDSILMREKALDRFDIRKQAQLYLKYSNSIDLKQFDCNKLKSKILKKIFDYNINYSHFLINEKFIGLLSNKEKQKVFLFLKENFKKKSILETLSTQIEWERSKKNELIEDRDWLKNKNEELIKDIDWLKNKNEELIKDKDWLKFKIKNLFKLKKT